MTDDDKQSGEPDPWADLDADAQGAGEGQAGGPAGGDDNAFNFDAIIGGFDDEQQLPAEPAFNAADDDGVGAPADGDIPLAVFPRHDAEAAAPDAERREDDFPVEPVEGQRPEIISMNGDDSFGSESAAAEDDFDDAQLARELGSMTPDDDPPDFGDAPVDPPADDVSFNADVFPTIPAGSPFAEEGLEEAFPQRFESSAEDLASIPLAMAAGAAATAAVTAAPPAVRTKKKKSGLGQLAGVVLGGVMALPVTYAILIWGFQKDPFKLARSVPDQLAFLVPQSLRHGGAAGGRQAAAPRASAPSLDDLPEAEKSSDEPAAETMAADGPAGEPAAADEATTDGPVSPPGSEEKMAADGGNKPDDDPRKEAPANLFVAATDVPAELAEEFRAALAKLGTTEEIQAALARLNAEDAPAPVAMPAVPQVLAVPAEPPALPPLDLTALEAAVAEAAAARDDLEAVADDDPGRKRLMVAWYKRLAALGEQFLLLESAAVESGRPLEQSPETVDGLLEHIRGSEPAIEDLRTLGRMWLASQKRRADGTVLVATVESTRQLGPYWSTRAQVAGPETARRSVAVISRTQPAADIGDQVLITGVLFDADTVWAADVRPLAAETVDAALPAIGVPPTFDEPVAPARVAKPPMVDEADGKVPPAAVETTGEGEVEAKAVPGKPRGEPRKDASEEPSEEPQEPSPGAAAEGVGAAS
jgi:hypothetical protein